VSYWEGRGGLDFLLETQARHMMDGDGYLRAVVKLEMVAFLSNESNATVLQDCLPSPDSPWYAIALMQRMRWVHGVASVPRVSRPVYSRNNKIQALIDRPLSVEPLVREEGKIIIPAASTSNPTRETRQIFFPKSFLGGLQLVLTVDSSVEYTLSPDMLTDTPTKYQLTCRVCTVHRNEDPILLTISPNQEGGPDDATVAVKMPYTVGMWEETEAVIVEIGGPGVTFTKLTVKRQVKQYAISIKDIKLVAIST
jgi:hypothetical protein